VDNSPTEQETTPQGARDRRDMNIQAEQGGVLWTDATGRVIR
jgi:hypothetical protein